MILSQNFGHTTRAAILLLVGSGLLPAGTIGISPLHVDVNPGDLFAFDIGVTDVTDLYAWQFDLGFDPAVLTALSVTEGEFLSGGGSTFFIAGSIDNSAGMVSANADALESAVAGVNGTGVIAHVMFEASGTGSSDISLSNVTLLDSGLNTISVDQVDGSATVSPEPSALSLAAGFGALLFAFMKRRRAAGLAPAVAIALIAGTGARAADIVTAQFDAARTMANPSEVNLTRANVNPTKFGKLFSRDVDGAIFAQPLVVQGLTVAGKKINVVYVATSHDRVYAFDADSPGASTPLWSVSLGTYDTPSGWPTGLGVLGTPVIVRSAGALYVVAATLENGARVQRLHALDLVSGAEKFGGAIAIAGTVPGTSLDAVNNVIAFDPTTHVQRTGLAIAGNNVIVAFGPDRDRAPYHGWVFSYDATSLRQTGVFNDSRNNSQFNGSGAGIWQSGRAPAIDSANSAYFETGNGDFDGSVNFGESFIKLSAGAQSLSLSDWFTPAAWSTLNDFDYDLGSTGPTLISAGGLLVGGSKTGALYVLKSGALGNLSTGDANAVQSFVATSGCIVPLDFQGCAQIMGQAFWGTATTPVIYIWGVHDVARAYRFVSGRFETTPVSTGTLSATYPGGVMALSSYLGTQGTGILWAITCDTPDNGFYFGPGFTGTATLRALDADNLGHELWNSGQNPVRDAVGTFASFAPPVPVNGKVYVPTFSNQLVVYGLIGGTVTGDVNGDSTVDCSDIAIVKASFGKLSGQSGFDLRADVNADGAVNVLDLATVTRQLPSGLVCH